MNPAAAGQPPDDIPWAEAALKVTEIREKLRAVIISRNAHRNLSPLIENCLVMIEEICDHIDDPIESDALRELMLDVATANLKFIEHQSRINAQDVTEAADIGTAADDTGNLWKIAYSKTNELRKRLRERADCDE